MTVEAVDRTHATAGTLHATTQTVVVMLCSTTMSFFLLTALKYHLIMGDSRSCEHTHTWLVAAL